MSPLAGLSRLAVTAVVALYLSPIAAFADYADEVVLKTVRDSSIEPKDGRPADLRESLEGVFLS